MSSSIRRLVALSVASLAAACGSADLPAPAALEPAARDTAELPEEEVVVVTARPREPEPSLSERWRSPFAVSSSGSVAAREPRAVTVLGADPIIADGIARDTTPLQSGRLPPPSSRPPATTAADDAPSVDVDDPDDDDSRRDRGDRRGDVRRSTVIHQVRVGDTLWGIARRYEVSVERIREANRLSDDRLRLDQTLIIPVD